MNPILCVGCGDIGRRVARLYSQGTDFSGWIKTSASERRCAEQGIRPYIVDLDGDYRIDNHINTNTRVFWFAPPPSTGEVDSRIRRFLDRLDRPPQRVVLISTTGVYGDCGGRWIDENEPLKPAVDRATRRVDAELALQDFCRSRATNWIILRVAGIYAKDRLPLARLKHRTPVINANEAPWTNRIQADDLAQACVLAMQSSLNNECYNVCDDRPSTMTDYFNQVADYAGIERPPQISLKKAQQVLSKGMLSYLNESRRISNKKICTELGMVLRYPTLADGLK